MRRSIFVPLHIILGVPESLERRRRSASRTFGNVGSVYCGHGYPGRQKIRNDAGGRAAQAVPLDFTVQGR
jgi:hypothetical protein